MARIPRREFLRLIGAGGVGAGAGFMLAESIKRPVEYLIPYAVPPEEFSPGIATWYHTVCSMCAAGCGILVRTREGRAKKIEGNPSHPVSQGRLCALGQAGLQLLYNPDRLTEPLMRTGERGSGPFVPITWEDGLAKLAERLQALRARAEAQRICLLTEGVRGHLAELLELFMAQLGSDRLLHYDFAHPHTLYAANRQFFGEEYLPYYDLKNTRYLLSFGADYLGSWLSPVHHSLGYGHSRQGLPEVRGRFVQIEPRMSLSGAAADEWIAAKPGTEGLLALALAHRIVSEGGYRGADRQDWVQALARYSPASVAGETGVADATIERIADEFANTQPGLAIGGGAAGHHSNGLDTLIAVNALNYLVGNLGKPGGLVFNPAPTIGRGSHLRQASYRTMLSLADDARQGRIDVLIVNGANPVFGLPAAAGFSESLAGIPMIVSLSSFMDETTALADLILPSHTYLESWGDDFPEPGVGFTVGAISQPVVAPLHNTRATGDIVLGLARQMGLGEALPWASTEEYLKQAWRAIQANGSAEVRVQSFESFWNDVLKAGVWGVDARRSPAAFAPERSMIAGIGVATPEPAGSPADYPFVLHPYLSSAFHDGRGANLPWMQEFPDPMTGVVYGSWVELNPGTARKLGLEEGAVVVVASAHGQIRAPVYLYPAIMPEVVAMPIGQGHTALGRYARNRGANPIQILAPQQEAKTGSLAWSATRVKITPTGEKVALVKTGGLSRQLGRGIVQTTEPAGGATHGARLKDIPITVVPS
jgi:anaerobic selenocysteine-containing dehydrogenase